MRRIIVSASLASVSMGFLWHLSNIARFGSHYIVEPNHVTLALEIAGMGTLLALGIFSLVLEIKNVNSRYMGAKGKYLSLHGQAPE